MNVREFYKWAQDNDCENYEINIECYDEEGDISEVWQKDWLDCRR